MTSGIEQIEPKGGRRKKGTRERSDQGEKERGEKRKVIHQRNHLVPKKPLSVKRRGGKREIGKSVNVD